MTTSPVTSFFLYLFSLAYLLLYLPFSLRIGPHHFQARGCTRRPNLGLSCFNLFFVFLMHGYVVNLVTCISLGLLYIFEVVSPGFDLFSRY